MKSFSRTVLPVLQQAAGMHVAVAQTCHRGHATEVAAQLDLASTDMLLCVGGDGTLWEALQVGRGAQGLQHRCGHHPVNSPGTSHCLMLRYFIALCAKH